jgi:large subunit ribosomal protein L15
MGTTLSTLKPPKGARTSRKRLGRGVGSGLGKTSGSGGKGQTARSGCTLGRGFEGGQMPLQRRLPKRGFTNPFRVEVESVNLDDLDRAFESGVVDPEAMRDRGVVPRKAKVIKVLGRGELSKALTVKAHRFSESARAKIVAAGGVAETLGGPAKETTAEAK